MSLSTTFNLNLSKLSTKINEIVLFRELCKALVHPMNIHTTELHGAKGFVGFDNPATCPSSQNIIKSELCDVAIVSFDKSMVRLTFLQAKLHEKIYHPHTSKLKLPVRQHFLLSQFPIVKTIGQGTKSFKCNALSNRTLDSIGSFGIFYKHGTNYEMDYQIGSLINACGPIQNYKYCANGTHDFLFNGKPNNIRTVKGFLEKESCDNLTLFEDSLNNMLIGDPIVTRDQNGKLEIINKDLYEGIFQRIIQEPNYDENPVLSRSVENFSQLYKNQANNDKMNLLAKISIIIRDTSNLADTQNNNNILKNSFSDK